MINLQTEGPYVDAHTRNEPEIRDSILKSHARRSTNDMSTMKKTGVKVMNKNASQIEYDRFDNSLVKIKERDTANGTSLPRIKQADFETSKAMNVFGNNKAEKDRVISLVDINKPVVQITNQGVVQPSPFTKEQSPPGDPFAGRGKRQYGHMKYA